MKKLPPEHIITEIWNRHKFDVYAENSGGNGKYYTWRGFISIAKYLERRFGYDHIEILEIICNKNTRHYVDETRNAYKEVHRYIKLNKNKNCKKPPEPTGEVR